MEENSIDFCKIFFEVYRFLEKYFLNESSTDFNRNYLEQESRR